MLSQLFSRHVTVCIFFSAFFDMVYVSLSEDWRRVLKFSLLCWFLGVDTFADFHAFLDIFCWKFLSQSKDVVSKRRTLICSSVSRSQDLSFIRSRLWMYYCWSVPFCSSLPISETVFNYLRIYFASADNISIELI